jgi:hypothetical protein
MESLWLERGGHGGPPVQGLPLLCYTPLVSSEHAQLDGAAANDLIVEWSELGENFDEADTDDSSGFRSPGKCRV